jgi:hypothetical protein
MQKIGKMRASPLDHAVLTAEMHDTRPRRVAGSTITGWPGALAVDLDALFARQPPGETIGGSSSQSAPDTHPSPANNQAAKTVTLSDGTLITFVTAG